MSDRAVLRVREDHTTGARMPPTTMLDDAVVDDNMMVHPFVRRSRSLANIDATAAEIVQMAMFYRRIRAAVFEPDTMLPRVGDLAIFKMNLA